MKRCFQKLIFFLFKFSLFKMSSILKNWTKLSTTILPHFFGKNVNLKIDGKIFTNKIIINYRYVGRPYDSDLELIFSDNTSLVLDTFDNYIMLTKLC